MNGLLNLIGGALHLACLALLALFAAGMWLQRGSLRGLTAIGFAAWGCAALAVSIALAGRDPLWLAHLHRDYRFEASALPAGEHHRIVSPPAGERLPQEADALRAPFRTRFTFTLTPEGAVQSVEATRVETGDPAAAQAIAAAMSRWRFGPSPDQGPAERVTVTMTNRYAALRSPLLLLAAGALFTLVWWALIRLLPAAEDQADVNGLSSVRRIALATAALAGFGWLIVYRIAVATEQHPLPGAAASWLLVGTALFAAGVMAAGRMGGPRAGDSPLAGCGLPALGVLLLLITRFTPLGASEGTNATLWLHLPGPFSFLKFQTIELVKLILLLFIARTAYGKSRAGTTERDARGDEVTRLAHPAERYRGLFGALALVMGALVLMSDLGPVLLLLLFASALLAMHGHRRAALGMAAALLLVMTAGALVGIPPRWHDRVAIWRLPWSLAPEERAALQQAMAANDRPAQRRFALLLEGKEHLARARWAVCSGGLAGAGLGRGRPEDVHEAASDFVFVAIAEEMGCLGAVTLLALLAYPVAAGLRLAERREDAAARLLIGGTAALFGLQAILILGGNLGCWPLTGITLPLLSYGGTSLSLTCLSLGMLVGAAIRPTPMSPPLLGSVEGASRAGLAALRRAVFPALLLLIGGRLAWLQALGGRAEAAQRFARADGTLALNPRLAVEPGRRIARGVLCAAGGEPIVQARSDGRVLLHPELWAQFTGPEGSGARLGLEQALDGALAGTLVLPDRAAPERGYDAVLTLDARLQRRAFDLLAHLRRAGAIVGIEPATGRIRFAVSRSVDGRPPVDSAEWLASCDGRPGASPFCWRTLYAPGSVFKTVLAAEALQSPDLASARFRCTGTLSLPGGRPIQDFERRHRPQFPGHGDCSLERALTVSCNSSFGQLGALLGWERLTHAAQQAGFGHAFPLIPEPIRSRRGVGLSTAPSALTAAGTDPEALPASERAPIFLAQTALGQRSVRMTPLHLAQWAATLANGGRAMEPSLLLRLRGANGATVWEHRPQEIGPAMPPETARRLTAMMRRVVERGTGTRARVPGLHVAGKTGSPLDPEGRSNALFIGFTRRIAVAVVIEGGETGGAEAAPLAAQMISAVANEESARPSGK